MTKISEQELLRRLETLDEETLQFMASYAVERQKLIKLSTLITSVLATVAGLTLAINYILPNISEVIIAVGSSVLASLVVGLGMWERKREEMRLVKRLLRDSQIGETNTNSERKRELIERLLKAEGL